MSEELEIHVEVWIAAQLLGDDGQEFSKGDLARKIKELFNDERPGVSTHISSHCRADAKADPGNYCYLITVRHGVFRCIQPGDSVHPTRKKGKRRPSEESVPVQYQKLLSKELSDSSNKTTPQGSPAPQTVGPTVSAGLAGREPIIVMPEIEFRGYRFNKVFTLVLETDSGGSLLEFQPHHRYGKEGNLNPYGTGPFCRFKIPSGYEGKEGVYLLVVDPPDELVYIGKTEDLSKRFNHGYGNISPKNCYVGGQNTNCKVNNKILNVYGNGRRVVVFFHETDKHSAVERGLLNRGRPPWNG